MNLITTLYGTRDIDIWGLPENVEVESARFVIQWEIAVEVREWGISDFSPMITNVSGDYELITYDENGNEEKTETVDFDFEPYRENCIFSAEWSEHRQLSISRLEIDLDAKTLEVS